MGFKTFVFAFVVLAALAFFVIIIVKSRNLQVKPSEVPKPIDRKARIDEKFCNATTILSDTVIMDVFHCQRKAEDDDIVS